MSFGAGAWGCSSSTLTCMVDFVSDASFTMLWCTHWTLHLLQQSWFRFCDCIKAKLGLVTSFSIE